MRHSNIMVVFPLQSLIVLLGAGFFALGSPCAPSAQKDLAFAYEVSSMTDGMEKSTSELTDFV
jgi:hypothetical protein